MIRFLKPSKVGATMLPLLVVIRLATFFLSFFDLFSLLRYYLIEQIKNIAMKNSFYIVIIAVLSLLQSCDKSPYAIKGEPITFMEDGDTGDDFKLGDAPDDCRMYVVIAKTK